MKKFKKLISMLIVCCIFASCLCACEASETDTAINNDKSAATMAAASIIANQPAPTDLDYSLERYNLIRRAYWVNGQREKAMSLPCAVDRPLGYIVLFSNSGAVIQKFVVDGKVSSLGSYLFPAEEDMCSDGLRPLAGEDGYNWASRTEDSVFSVEIPGIDGAYGSNVFGIFFFTSDGKYIEWTGDYLYSDIPFDVGEPVLKTDAQN